MNPRHTTPFIGSVGLMGAFLQIPDISPLTDALDRFGAIVILAVVGMIVLVFIARSSANRSDATSFKDRNESNMLLTLIRQHNDIVQRYLEDSNANRTQQERLMKQQDETNSATIRALTEVTEAVKHSIDIEADGRNQAVRDLKTAFVDVHEETMTELRGVGNGVAEVKKTVTDDLSEMKTTLNGIRERLPDVADKQDVKVILDMLDALSRKVDSVETKVERLTPEPVTVDATVTMAPPLPVTETTVDGSGTP